MTVGDTPPPAPEADLAIDPHPWERLAELIARGERRPVRLFLESLHGSDTVLAISRLPDEQQTQLLTMLRPDTAADLVEQLSEAHAVDLVERLEPRTAAAIIDELPSDEQADLIGELEEADAEAILGQLDPDVAGEVRALVAYGNEVAGGLMVTEYLAYRDGSTVAEVVADLREHGTEYANYDIQYAYVNDARDRLIGVLRLRDLLLSPPQRPIRAIMIRNPLSVRADADLNALRQFFDEHPILGVPVLGKRRRLLGVVHRAALEEALAERSEEDYRRSQGIIGGEELRTMPLAVRSRRRLSWLSLNILLNIAAASIIAFFEATLQAVIALAVFLPIISDMSGCSGSQAVAVSIRELSLGYVRPTELLHVWLKEISVGLINGVALGVLVALVAWAWKGNAWLGLVVGTAMALNTMVAVSIGGVIPLILKRLGRDPALASGPILTTVTDMCGFFLVLGFATLAMPYLR